MRFVNFHLHVVHDNFIHNNDLKYKTVCVKTFL